MAALCTSHPGPTPVYIEWNDGNGESVRLRSRSLRVALEEDLVRALRELLGADAVHYVKAQLTMAPSAYTLDFEKPLQELERQIEELERLGEERQIDVSTELRLLQDKLHAVREDIYRGLTPIQRVMVARHPRRPYTLDYLSTDLHRLHRAARRPALP